MTASKTSAIGSFADVPLHADGAAPAAPTPEQATAAVDAPCSTPLTAGTSLNRK